MTDKEYLTALLAEKRKHVLDIPEAVDNVLTTLTTLPDYNGPDQHRIKTLCLASLTEYLEANPYKYNKRCLPKVTETPVVWINSIFACWL